YPLGAFLFQSLGLILYALTIQAVGLFVFLRRPDLPAARVLLIAASSSLSAVTWFLGMEVGDLVGGMGHWLFRGAGLMYVVFGSGVLHFALIFPRPHPLPGGRPWAARAVSLVPVALALLSLAASRLATASLLEWLGGWTRATRLPYALTMAVAVAVRVSGYRERWDLATRRRVRAAFFAAVAAGVEVL